MQVTNRHDLIAVLLVLAIAAPAYPFAPGSSTLPLRAMREAPRGIAGSRGSVAPALTARLGVLPEVHIDVDRQTGDLRAAVGVLTGESSTTAEPAASKFVTSALAVPVAPPGRSRGHALAIARREVARGGTHVTFQHELDGKPVFGEEVAVHLDARGRVTALIGDYHELDANRGPELVDARGALAVVRRHFDIDGERTAPSIRPVWVLRDGRHTAGFEVRVAAVRPFADLTALVSATDGALLGADDELCYATGQGRVFPHSGLDPELVTVPLGDLLDPSRLSGTFVNVRNEDAPGAVSHDGLFAFEPSDTHFDEVMVYHNLSRVHAFFAGLGFHGRDRVNHATVHYGNAFDNAAYSPMTGKFIFGDGKKLNDLAQEDDIAFHEFTHAVVGSIASSMSGGEAGAINEAVSDYFAGTLSGDPRMGAWAGQKLGLPWMRHLENSKHYPEDLENEVHKDSEIYSGACWEVRRQLGAAVTDALVLKSFYHFGHRPDFARGLAAMLAADQALHGGANAGVIRKAFAGRGITAGGRGLWRQAAYRHLLGAGRGPGTR